MLIGLLLSANFADAEVFNSSMQTNYDLEKIKSIINEERAKLNLSPLEFSGKLQLGALHKALDMHEHSYFAHYRPADNSMGIKQLADMVNFNYTYLGETLALNYTTEQAVVTGFMNSPSHRDILMSPKAKYIGIDFTNYYYEEKPSNIVVVLVGDTYRSADLTEDEEVELSELTNTREQITEDYYKTIYGEESIEEPTFSASSINKSTLKITDTGDLKFEFTQATLEKEVKVVIFGFKKPYTENPYKYKYHAIDNNGTYTESLENLEMGDYDDFYIGLVTVDQEGQNHWSFFELISR